MFSILNKWSSGFCLVPLQYQAYVKIKSEQFTLLATHLGVLQINSLSFNDICLHFGANMASFGCYSFLNKRSWGLRVVPLLYQAYVKIQSVQFFRLATSWGILQIYNLAFSDFDSICAQILQAACAPNFQINCPRVPVWFYYSAMHERSYNQYNLPHCQRIWVHIKEITSLFRFWLQNRAKLGKPRLFPDFFNK